MTNSFGTSVALGPTSLEGRDQTDLRRRQNWWWALIALIVCSSAVCWLSYPTLRVLVDTWRTPTFSHCFLILPISLYLIWTRKDEIAPLTPKTNLWVLLLLAALEILWIVGRRTGVFIVQEFAFVAIFPVLAWLFLGTEITRRIRFPLAFLFFAVPAGVSLIPPLQDFTAAMAGRALEISGVPVLREGRLLFLPDGAFQIARECSGVRFLIASITYGSVVAFLFFRSWWRRCAFLLASVIVPVLANGLRAYGLILLAYFTNNRLATGIDHVIYGWIFFSLLLAVLVAAASKWRETTATPSSLPLESAASLQKPTVVAPVSRFFFVALAAVGILASGPLLNSSGRPSDLAREVQLPSLEPTAPWRAVQENSARWKPKVQSAAVDSLQAFTSTVGQVDLYVAYLSTGADTPKPLVQPDVTFLDPLEWAMISERFRDIELDGRPLRVQEVTLHEGRVKRLVWSWYWIGGDFAANPLRARFLEAKERLLRTHAGGAIIAVSAESDREELDLAVLLQDFLKHASVEQYLNSIGP